MDNRVKINKFNRSVMLVFAFFWGKGEEATPREIVAYSFLKLLRDTSL